MTKKVFVTSAMADFLNCNKEEIESNSYFIIWEKFTESNQYMNHLDETVFFANNQTDWSLEMALAIKYGWKTEGSKEEKEEEKTEFSSLVVPKYQFDLLAHLENESTNDSTPGFENMTQHEVVSYYVYKAMKDLPNNNFLVENHKAIIQAIICGKEIGYKREDVYLLRRDSYDAHGDMIVEFLVDISLSKEGNKLSYDKRKAHKFKNKEEATKYLPILGEGWTLVTL